jgi:branched-chain amino acid transport system permease protein
MNDDTDELAPVTEGAAMRLTSARHITPWLIGFAALLPLPWLTFNDYQRYLLDIILINVILAVGLNIVKGFAGQVTVATSRRSDRRLYVRRAGAKFGRRSGSRCPAPCWSPPSPAPSSAFRRFARGRLPGAGHTRTRGVGAHLHLGDRVSGASIGLERHPPPSLFGYRLTPTSATTTWSAAGGGRGLLSFCMLRSNIGRGSRRCARTRWPRPRAASTCRSTDAGLHHQRAVRGCAGSLAAHMTPGFIHPNSYTLVEMVTLLLMVVLGGIGHIWGGIVGAILVTIIYDLTRDYYQYQLLIFGLVIVLTVMFMPTGIGGLIDRYLVTRGFLAIRKAKQNAA